MKILYFDEMSSRGNGLHHCLLFISRPVKQLIVLPWAQTSPLLSHGYLRSESIFRSKLWSVWSSPRGSRWTRLSTSRRARSSRPTTGPGSWNLKLSTGLKKTIIRQWYLMFYFRQSTHILWCHFIYRWCNLIKHIFWPFSDASAPWARIVNNHL